MTVGFQLNHYVTTQPFTARFAYNATLYLLTLTLPTPHYTLQSRL
jgi:hypothetical protein